MVHYSGMSRKSGRKKRLDLYDRGNTVCPICLTSFTRDQASDGRKVTLEHVPTKALGGQARCLTCGNCNSQAGRGIDQAAAMTARDRFGVTVDILGKRDTFMLSLDGKELTQPFAGYSKRDFQNLENTDSRRFTMSIAIPQSWAVAASSLKSAYLAVFSLLGPGCGYSYVRGNALTPVRRLVTNPQTESAVGNYVTKAPDDVDLNDIILVSEPVACWMLRIADHLVFLPLGGDSRTIQPLQEMGRGRTVDIEGYASWSFSTFGAFGTVQVHLPGADTVKSLVGLNIRGTLPSGNALEGICINHSSESATLLCPGPPIGRAAE